MEVIVHADAHDVVGHVGAQSDRGERRHAGKGVVEGAEVHIEVFQFRRPIVAERTFNAAAHGPTGADGVEVVDAGDGAEGEGFVAIDAAIGETAGDVEQPRRGRQDTDATAHGPEPAQFLGIGQGASDGNKKTCGAAHENGAGRVRRRRTALAAALNIGLQPNQPRASLPIVTDLAAANDAVEIGRCRAEGHAGERGRVASPAEAATEVQAGVPTGPVIDRRRWRHGLERHIGRAGRLDRRKGCEHRACYEKLFHRIVPPVRGQRAIDWTLHISKPASRIL